MEEWIPIPGFPRYQVCTTRPGFKSNWYGEWREKKLKGAKNTILSNGEGTYGICWARALYCAQKGIDPRKIRGADVRIYQTPEGKLEVMTVSEMQQITTKKRLQNKAKEMDDGGAERKYREIIEFATISIDFLQTGDGEKLSSYMYGKKKYLMAHLMMKYKMSKRRAEEIAAMSIEETIRIIQERRDVVAIPTAYMKKIANTIISKEKRCRIVQRDSYLMERITQ